MTVHPLSDDQREVLGTAVSEAFLHGNCYAMAIALHRRTGWPLAAAVSRDGRMSHAGVRRPDGMLLDVRGTLDESGFLDGYIADGIAEVSEAALVGADPDGIDERVVAADFLLDHLFPGIPPSNRVDRVAEFLADLHDLCVRHHFYVRASFPGAPPVLYERYGDETGFDASPLPFGGWAFDRCKAPA